MRFLNSNYAASYRESDKVLRECKGNLSKELPTQLKRVLHHHNPKKIIGHVTVDKRRQSRACGNHAFVSKNTTKVYTTLSKQQCDKHVAVIPCWLEKFFHNLHLTSQGLICREGKNDRLAFYGSFLETPFFTCMN